MNACLTKLSNISDILTKAILVMQDAIKSCNENKMTLMRWEGGMLHTWIEHLVVSHNHSMQNRLS